MAIIGLKLTSSEDIMGEVESESETQYVINNPVSIKLMMDKTGQPQVGFAPFPPYAEPMKNTTVSIDKSRLVYYYTPAQDFVNNYNQVFGSGIVVPPKTLIMG
jgi:hypothetical protein